MNLKGIAQGFRHYGTHIYYRVGRLWFVPCFVSLFLAACTSPAATLETPAVLSTRTPTPVPTRTPLPTWTPTPIPTATPIPPAVLRIHWPYSVNALEPVPIEVELISPAGTTPQASIQVTVLDPAEQIYAVFDLRNREGFRYYADASLQLPLDPLGGYWWLIAEVDSPMDVEGTRVQFFIPDSIHFRPLDNLIPQRVRMRIPIAFTELQFQGDTYAGSRQWQYQDGKIGLWWVPGPTEKLIQSNAVTILEASFPEDNPPLIVDVAETLWQNRVTYVFNLVWPDAQPGMAWVVQDKDFWLYLLDIHALDGGKIPTLIEQVASTVKFID